MIFYRYEDWPYVGGEPQILERQFHLLRETPQGYWIIGPHNFLNQTKRWVSKTARKRYAYPTKKEAWNSLIARKRRQIAILSWQIERAKEALQFALIKDIKDA